MNNQNDNFLIENDDYPIFQLVVAEVGEQPAKVFAVLRQVMKLSPAEAKRLLQTQHFEVVRGARMEVDSIKRNLNKWEPNTTRRGRSRLTAPEQGAAPDRLQLRSLVPRSLRFRRRVSLVVRPLALSFRVRHTFPLQEGGRHEENTYCLYNVNKHTCSCISRLRSDCTIIYKYRGAWQGAKARIL